MAFEEMISKDLYLSFEDRMLINGFVMYETEKINAKLLRIFYGGLQITKWILPT